MIASEMTERLNLFLLLLRSRVSSSDPSGLLEGDNRLGVSFDGVCGGGLKVGDTRVLMSSRGGVGRTGSIFGSDPSVRRKSSIAWLARLCDAGGRGRDPLLILELDVVDPRSRWAGDGVVWTCDDERGRDVDPRFGEGVDRVADKFTTEDAGLSGGVPSTLGL